jgi:hypothetical protein
MTATRTTTVLLRWIDARKVAGKKKEKIILILWKQKGIFAEADL